MSEMALFFKVTLKDGCVDDFLAAVEPVAAAARDNEPGTLEYRIHTADGNVVWFYERYADEAAMAVHAQSPEIAELFGKVGSMIEGAPEMQPGTGVDL